MTMKMPTRRSTLALLAAAAAAVFPALGSADAPAPRTVDIVVDGSYSPARVVIRRGEPTRLRFTRRDYSSCTREVVFPALGIRKSLPTGVPVVVDLPVDLAVGTYEFRCGMNMVRGSLVVVAPDAE